MRKSCLGANELVWPEDGQTSHSQAKENLKVVAIMNTSECLLFIFTLFWWHVWDGLQNSTYIKCLWRMWSPGRCAKISGRSGASVTGQGKFGGTKSRVAGLLGAWHVGDVCRKSSRTLSESMPSTVPRLGSAFVRQIVSGWSAMVDWTGLTSECIFWNTFSINICFHLLSSAGKNKHSKVSAYVRQESCWKRARSRRLQTPIWRSQFMDTMYQNTITLMWS